MALHSEIKINYYVLSDIVASLKGYEQALTDMQTSLSNIDRVIAESEGKAFDALRKIEHNFDGEIETCRQEIKDIYTSIENYIRDMSAIISDVPPGSTVLVDRNDIYWNLQSIKEACREIGRAELDTVYRTVQYEDPSELVQIKEDERRGEAMRAEIRKTSEEIEGYCRALEEIYRTDVCSFEDMDDEHAQKMNALHAKYTSQKEGWREIGKLGADFVKGAFDDVKALATGIKDIPQIPKALKGMTPETFVEQLCQGASDAVAEKGYAYGSGYTAAEIGVSVLATKGLDKIEKGVKTLKGTEGIGKDLKRVIKPGDIKKPGKLVPDVEDDIARIGKPGAIEGGGSLSEVSKRGINHSFNKHFPSRFIDQASHMTPEQLDVYFTKNTFFNPNWTEEQATDAVNFAYNQALSNGITTGTYETTYLGEKITVALTEGNFSTAYGNYCFSLEEFMSLFGGN